MQPYDGIDYRLSTDGPDREKAIATIARILGFQPSEVGIDYSLNFYSGGTRIDDRLAIRCRFSSPDWPTVVSKLGLVSPSQALSDLSWTEDFRWLVSGDNPGQDLDDDCRQFINSNRREFQDAAELNCEFLFSSESNVNTWCVVWVVNENLNYLSFDQG